MTLRFDAAVTGIGMISAAGVGVEAGWRRILGGEPTAARDPALAGMPVEITCRATGFDGAAALGGRVAWRMDRSAHLAVAATREAVADAGLRSDDWDAARVAVVMGTALGGVDVFEQEHRKLLDADARAVSPLLVPMMGLGMIAGNVALDRGSTGPALTATTACASGTTAIGLGRELLRAGACDVAIVGGAESALSRTIMAGFSRMGALSGRNHDPAAASRPFDAGRDGFVAGEGAGVLVLERVEDARARGARVRARLSGFASSADAHHITAPRPDGGSVDQALCEALADAGLLPDEIDHVNAHGTSTPLNDALEARVVRRVLGDRPVVTSVKGVTGHALGASGGIEAVCTVLSLQDGVVPPTANLDRLDDAVELDVVSRRRREVRLRSAVSNSFGFGGLNAILVFTAA
ncbi:beta-ketoacyl-[acyl-carrier-protein] synthase family protein [Saccharothrix sp. NPDC042600]|uniref:beta-ketoacyl-[acyl-carrier-protein] synthase family protein n=1 Tax=Saccharothrix TaxID=2071 RepID=UPI0033C2B8E7|nr:beta-ketoacyl-[acyl-carrier-protein] synthase family protein [Saccharothrix mutabilis subsp. capreolus]